MEWIHEKIGALYVANLMLEEEAQRLRIENEELKKPKEPVGPGGEDGTV